MTINNLQTIKSLLFFDNPGDVYVVQVMTRAKDFVKPHYSTIIREYYVESVDYLDTKFDEITKLCEVFNARAYINLNRKNTRVLGQHISSELAKIAQQKTPNYFDLIGSALSTVESNRRVFMIDVNTHDASVLSLIRHKLPDHALTIVSTPNGYHVLTTPFDARILNSIAVVHKNSPTVLYAN